MDIKILDGSFGGTLRQRFPQRIVRSWSAHFLFENPEAVLQLHKDYIDAGWDIIETNTYSTIPHWLKEDDQEENWVELTKVAGQLARQAVTESGKTVQIAGSIPPLSDSYRPDLVPNKQEAMDIYGPMVEALVPYVDMFLCETMSSAQEAVIAAQATCEHSQGQPVWVSWTLNDIPGQGLRSGESITSAYNLLQELPIHGFMFNWTTHEACIEGIKELRSLTTKPLGCFPNKFESMTSSWIQNPALENPTYTLDYFIEKWKEWIEAGASVVGGCCGIRPEDIAALVNNLKCI